ncbi:MAG TPA: hypothetical protein VFN74_19410 [Chloroflexota bacterium]|nr:hypothetical protein [Chloroflexota bacterium]
MGLSDNRGDRRLSPHEVALLRALVSAGALLAGVLAGLSAAAGALALIGRSFLELEPGRIQLLLVVGPLLGLWPPAVLCYVAAQSPLVRRWTPLQLLVWFGSAVAATLAAGLYSLFLPALR